MINTLFCKSTSRYFFFITTFFLLFLTLLNCQKAYALPAFARQTDMACNSCHFQSFPALNSFGRVFKAGGYTLPGSQTRIEGDNRLSLPGILNASVVTKIRYQLDDQVDENRGEIQWPDEAALMVGGRASEKIGFLLELGLGPVPADVDTGTGTLTCTGPATNAAEIQANCTADTGTGAGNTHGTFLSSKFHFKINDEFAIIPFSTDGLGVGYGFELLNTGAQRSQRPIENRKGFSAGQALGTASGSATGIAFIYNTPDWFVNYSHWTPTWGNAQVNIFGGLAHYLRLAYTPNLGGWDTGFGISSISGDVESGATNPGTITYVDSWTIDAQAQGELYEMPFGLYASYGVVPKSSVAEPNHYNSSTTDDESAYGLVGKLSVIPGRTQIYMGYALHDNNAIEITTTTIGLQEMMTQNVKLELFTTSSDSTNPADDYTMLMLFAGF